jgi:hypothetical protein
MESTKYSSSSFDPSLSNRIYNDTFTTKEKEALIQLKSELVNETEFTSSSTMLNDDNKLICFLRARKLDIPKSKKMILKYLNWYKTNNVNGIYFNYIWDKQNEFTLFYPHGFHKTAKSGEPILLQALGHVKVNKLFQTFTLDSIVKHSIKLYETMQREVFPKCSQVAQKYIHSIITIIDLRKLGKDILNNKIYALLQVILQTCQDYYPESLGNIFIINTGFAFKVMYTVVKTFIDKKTTSKIKIYGKKYNEALNAVISKDNLPDLFGGKCKCEPFGCLFSNAGPWNDNNACNVNVSDDIMKKRKELCDSIRHTPIIDDETTTGEHPINDEQNDGQLTNK